MFAQGEGRSEGGEEKEKRTSQPRGVAMQTRECSLYRSGCLLHSRFFPIYHGMVNLCMYIYIYIHICFHLPICMCMYVYIIV